MKRSGVFRHSELLAIGETKHTIEQALRNGHLRRLRWGWHALPDADADVVEAVRRGGVLSCVSALDRIGVWVPRVGDAVHVRGCSQAHRRRDDYCRQHGRPEPEVSAVDDVAIALRHAIRCITDPEGLVAVFDSVLNLRLLTLDELHTCVARAPLAIRRLVESADPRADSGLETISRLRLRAVGFDVEPQVYINGVGFVDLLVEGRVIVELDGRQHRDDSVQYAKDRRRDRVAQLGDYLILRLDSTDVFARWRAAERDVRRLVELTSAHRSA